jgi:hypothetical protein
VTVEKVPWIILATVNGNLRDLLAVGLGPLGPIQGAAGATGPAGSAGPAGLTGATGPGFIATGTSGEVVLGDGTFSTLAAAIAAAGGMVGGTDRTERLAMTSAIAEAPRAS